MKVTSTRKPTVPTFEPVTITIVLETAAEVQAAYDVGNWSFQVAGFIQEKQPGQASIDAIQKVLAAALFRPLYTLFPDFANHKRIA